MTAQSMTLLKFFPEPCSLISQKKDQNHPMHESKQPKTTEKDKKLWSISAKQQSPKEEKICLTPQEVKANLKGEKKGKGRAEIPEQPHSKKVVSGNNVLPDIKKCRKCNKNSWSFKK